MYLIFESKVGLHEAFRASLHEFFECFFPVGFLAGFVWFAQMGCAISP